MDERWLNLTHPDHYAEVHRAATTGCVGTGEVLGIDKHTIAVSPEGRFHEFPEGAFLGWVQFPPLVPGSGPDQTVKTVEVPLALCTVDDALRAEVFGGH